MQPLPRHRRAVAHWLLGLVLAVGGAMVWLIGLKIVIATAAQWSSGRPKQEHRELTYLADGEPVVRLIRYRQVAGVLEPAEQEFESLDGRPISPTSENQSNALLEHWRVSHFAGDKPSPLIQLRLTPFTQMRDPLWWRRERREPFPWSARLQQFHEQTPSRVPISRWFFVWPERRAGTGYFVGYDLKTSARLGYLGTEGFSQVPVPESQQFPAWNSDGTRVARLVTETNEWNQETSNMLPVHEPQNPFEVGLYFVTPNRDRAYRISFT
ncbi:MAG: hypothetical protein IAG10_28005, partial [Planctomycetaceae bacterium]|nr:hypothetical protein [Planctomycetaceae bacterium]